MRWLALCLLAFAAASSAWSQSGDEKFGAALQSSLARARALYPDSTDPNTVLGEAVQSRIAWLQKNEPSAFTDPDWPMKVAAAQAKALGMGPRQRSPYTAPPAAAPAAMPEPMAPAPLQRRYLALVTKNFSVVGANFRKNQQIVLESLQNDNKRGTTIVDGRPYLLWLDNIQLLRELPPGVNAPPLVKVESAKYGFPGKSGLSVAPMVQSLVAPSATGALQILVSDALLTPITAQKLNRSVTPSYVSDPNTGVVTLGIPYKVLTVTYSLNGQKKTKQAYEGQTLTLD